MHSRTDRWLVATDMALRTLFAPARAVRANPALQATPAELSDTERRHAAGLMRVNHVGEVCAQALYTAQALSTRNAGLRADLLAASAEEADHLAWTYEQVQALGGRVSLLNPLWFAGAFGLGLLAGRAGDAVNLGFLAETERQVGTHLEKHLHSPQGLPAKDAASRAIVVQMHADELAHARMAEAAGATELPRPVKTLMRMASRVMTTVAQRI